MTEIEAADTGVTMHRAAGRIARLWRYPVKSMLGEICEWLELHPGGVVGDRCYAIRHEDGRLGSGKTTGELVKIDGLLDFEAGYRGEEPEIRFPDGSVRSGAGEETSAALSEAIGQRVALAREAEASYFDVAPIHLITTASLAWLAAALPDAGIDERRFRPNLVIDVPGDGPVEQDWLGCRLRAGEVELEVTEPTERCGMVSLAQRELAGDPRILRYIVREADLQFGVYARVIVPGTIRQGDAVTFP